MTAANTSVPSDGEPFDDGVDAFLGVSVESIEPGYSRLAMTVSQRMINRHGTCHGGAIFAFADAALGYASNSHGPIAVATGGDVNFLKPPRLGDALVAECRERNRTRRTALYEVEVRNRHSGQLMATLSGRIAYPDIKPSS
jgi:acyl-CoA thioesterase